MTKGVIQTIINQSDKEWSGKILRKRTVQMIDGVSGTVTLFPEDPEIEVGQEIEFDIENKGYGDEIKIKRESKGGGGGGFPRANPRDKALASAVGIIKSALESNQMTPAQVPAELIAFHKLCLALIEGDDALPF